MKHIPIQLTKDEVLQLRRGGKIDYFYNGTAVKVEIIGPAKKPKTTSDNFATPMKMNPWGTGDAKQ